MAGGNTDDVTIRLDSEGTAEVASALESVDQAAEQTDDTLDDLGRSGERAGQRVERGMDRAARGTKRARDAQGRFLPVNRAVGDSLDRTGRKAATASVGMDRYAAKVRKATRALGGMRAMLMLVKWGTIIVALTTIVALVVALAAGAVMAVGGLSPMVGTLAAIGPLAIGGALAMGTLAVSMDDVKALMSPLAFSVLALRTQITQRLAPGITALTNKLQSGLIPVLLAGMLTMADSISVAADRLGDMLTQAAFVNRLGALFQGLDPLIQASAGSLGYFLHFLVALSLAALPMTIRMAEGLERVTGRLARWMAMMQESGRAQRWFNRAWETTIAVGRVLRDWLIGLYHLFRLAGQVAREEFGGGLAASAARFREWTQSAEGTQRILEYFRATIPTIRETGRLLAALAAGLTGLAADPNIAPLLAQIRTELLPALGLLMDNLMQAGGLGPALISMFTALAAALGAIPLTGLIWVMQAVAGVAWAIAHLVETVPGLGPAIGLLLSLAIAGGALGKIVGLFFLLGKGLRFFGKPLGWVLKLLAPVLLRMGLLGFLLNPIPRLATAAGTALRFLGGALMFVGRALLVAFLANPIGIALLAIAGLLVFLWFRFGWFRDGVKTVLREIGDFFVWMWSSAIGRVALLLAAPLALFAALRGGAWLLTQVAGASRLLAVAAGPLATILGAAAGALRAVGAALLFVGRALLGLILANPIIAAIVAVVLILVWMWFKFEWFRDAVKGALQAIGDFFGYIFGGRMLTDIVGLLVAGYGLWLRFKSFMIDTVFRPIGSFVMWIVNGIISGFTTAGNIIGGAFQTIVNLARDAYNWLARGWNSIPDVTVPSWVPLVGGQTWGLPDLPMLFRGGTIQYDTALVGEQGPEALVHGGRVSMLGAHGPEIATGLPKGGYVVPNLDTLNRLPGLTKQIPGGVADAVSRALPAYGSVFGGRGADAPASTDVQVHVDTGSADVVDAIETLTAVLVSQHRTPGEARDPAEALAAVLRQHDQDGALRARYSYPSPRRPR